MKLVFAGTPEFAAPTLRALVGAGHEVALVVTQPDRPAGRGRAMEIPAVKRVALELHLSVLQPESINLPEVLGAMRYLAPDAMVVEAFGQKLSPEVLALPRLGCFNVHASLLPAYRGAAPINHAILNGETRTGVTIIRMAERIDAGEVLAQQELAIDLDWNAGDLSDALSPIGAQLMVRSLAEVESGRAKGVPQGRKTHPTAPKLWKKDGEMWFQRGVPVEHNHVRGMTPWPGAFTFTRDGRTGRELRLVVLRTSVASDADAGSAAPGTVVASDHRGLVVACTPGCLRLERVKPAGSHEMSADEFARGHGIKVGSRFGAL
jgi:methionyl-tRNA formyltransferase